MIVYKVTNIINKKVYIGCTKRELLARWKSHMTSARNGSSLQFHRAIRKHGAENFKIEMLSEHETYESMTMAEIKEIQKYKSNCFQFGYNSTPGGTGGYMLDRLSKEDYDVWVKGQRIRSSGSRNPNASSITNQEIEDIATEYYKKHNRLPSVKTLRKIDDRIPKHFTSYRFGGYPDFLKHMKDKLNIQNYNHWSKTEEMKEKIRNSISGKKVWVVNSLNEVKFIKIEELEHYNNLGFKRGRKWL